MGLNQTNIEYACLGNHEFDLGQDTLQDRAAEFKGKLINSNITSPCCANLPRYSSVKVGDNIVVIAGACTVNTGIYRPAVCPERVSVSDGLINV